ncbi:hypothetical protein P154DRAFT_563873 [Amniculicola lignicola CBS 123094]|uniref:Xylanolytic transcriptional activator regulatory domain-containing protein n=1 Tax=Amniculicola lignicola CBS 123094 TaxID=1392246 RepID=A0A6A5WPN5_9PLEO|nr:hypothetical protein P154DRAFT_563873 [Amniculicola lignicola CBS 123094]
MRVIGSIPNMVATATDFFTGTHQRIPVLSSSRFFAQIGLLATNSRADFTALCLCIVLIQQMPSARETSITESPLYVHVKNLLSVIQMTNTLSLGLLHCIVLVSFYEIGHGHHTAAYLAIASCARLARVLGLHKKRWRNINEGHDKLLLEEEKRVWWAITNMDRFISLFNGDALFITEDPERTDPLPIEDLLWAEGSVATDLESAISTPPYLETPFTITVGQMARECQIAHLVGRAVRHVFSPVPDADFHAAEAVQLERTLKAYLPLLAEEELKIGKYCGAFGMCNSALFMLYESMLGRGNENQVLDRREILQLMEDASLRALAFAQASYSDREENYPPEIHSPYLPYSLFKSAIVQYQLWKQKDDSISKQRFDILRGILSEFTKRWMGACSFISIGMFPG